MNPEPSLATPTSTRGIDRPGTRGRSRWFVEVRTVDAATRRRTVALATAAITAGLAVFAVALVGVVTKSGLELLDRPVEQWMNARRDPDATGVMTVLAVVFGPVGMPIVVALTLVIWIVLARHLWRPLILLGGMLTGVVLAQVLAPIVRHPRPPIGMMLLAPDHTFSFPSGHVLGMADFFLLSAFLLASRRRKAWFTAGVAALAAGCVTAQAVSRMYLGYHWLTDVVGSIALSSVIVGTVVLIDTKRTVRVGVAPDGTTARTPGRAGT